MYYYVLLLAAFKSSRDHINSKLLGHCERIVLSKEYYSILRWIARRPGGIAVAAKSFGRRRLLACKPSHSYASWWRDASTFRCTGTGRIMLFFSVLWHNSALNIQVPLLLLIRVNSGYLVFFLFWSLIYIYIKYVKNIIMNINNEY